MPTFERRHPVSAFIRFCLEPTGEGSLCSERPSADPKRGRASGRRTKRRIHDADGASDFAPLPDRSRFLQVRGPFQEEPNSLFRSGPYTGPKQRATRYPPESTARASPAVPSPARPPSLRDVRIRSATVFRSTKPFGPQPFSRPGGFRPPSLPRAREPETGRPLNLPTLSGRTVSAGRSAGLRLTGRHPRSHFPAFPFSMEPLAASFCPGLPGAIRLLCRKS